MKDGSQAKGKIDEHPRKETYSKSLCIKKEKNANVSVTLPEVYVSRPARTELRGACSLVPSPVTSV